MMTTKALEYFLVVVKYLNISHAAKELYISQPALSKQISLLEQELGVQLFERSKQKLKLTNAGEVLVKEANELFRKRDELILNVRRAGSHTDNSLVIHYMSGSLNTNLPEAISNYMAKNPKVELTLENSIPNLIFPNLVNEEIDVGLILAATTVCPSSLRMKSLTSDQLYVAVPNNHPYAQLDNISFAEIDNQTLLMLDSLDAPFQHSLLPFFLHGKQQEKHNRVVNIKSMEQVIALARAGQGIAFVAKKFCKNDISALQMIPIRDAVPIHLCVAWNPQNVSPLLKEFLEKIF